MVDRPACCSSLSFPARLRVAPLTHSTVDAEPFLELGRDFDACRGLGGPETTTRPSFWPAPISGSIPFPSSASCAEAGSAQKISVNAIRKRILSLPVSRSWRDGENRLAKANAIPRFESSRPGQSITSRKLPETMPPSQFKRTPYWTCRRSKLLSVRKGATKCDQRAVEPKDSGRNRCRVSTSQYLAYSHFLQRD